jgi:hypothetical protein
VGHADFYPNSGMAPQPACSGEDGECRWVALRFDTPSAPCAQLLFPVCRLSYHTYFGKYFKSMLCFFSKEKILSSLPHIGYSMYHQVWHWKFVRSFHLNFKLILQIHVQIFKTLLPTSHITNRRNTYSLPCGSMLT